MLTGKKKIFTSNDSWKEKETNKTSKLLVHYLCNMMACNILKKKDSFHMETEAPNSVFNQATSRKKKKIVSCTVQTDAYSKKYFR